MTPRFSILHPTRRFPQWKLSYDKWLSRCADPSQVEYVLCMDVEDAPVGFETSMAIGSKSLFRPFRSRLNHGTRSSTTAYNEAAAASTGDWLICSSDDVFPPLAWDQLILKAPVEILQCNSPVWFSAGSKFVHDLEGNLIRSDVGSIIASNSDCLLHPGTGYPERDKQIVFQPIMSRGRYKKLGYFFYPEYQAMYADNDLTEHAEKDGAIIPIPSVQLEHKHPVYGTAAWDETYAHENRPENYELGEKLLKERRARGFAS